MVVLDACAVIALAKEEPAAAAVDRMLQAGRPHLTAVGLVEVLDHLARIVGMTERQALLDLAELGLHDPPPLTARESRAAGALRARHYHRVRRPVSLADCVAAAVAGSTGQPLATSDPALLDLCHEEGIGTVPLPGSDGRLWSPG